MEVQFVKSVVVSTDHFAGRSVNVSRRAGGSALYSMRLSVPRIITTPQRHARSPAIAKILNTPRLVARSHGCGRFERPPRLPCRGS